MTTKLSLTTLAAAAAFALAGVATAQTTSAPANPPTSTAGNGCTATGNAMRGGNLGGTATNKDCGTPATSAAVVAPAATTETTTSTTTSAGAGSAPVEQAPAAAKPVRTARADRN